ncbi:unnamed protein product [Cylicocyclus nassatus]|uniref:C2 domain-containing protein n=1 Tax=Cylicocyclus nassatus TaxID=53992 RepID=A0AA36M5A5_CYLNA|nr:unnamed protein product [Cylicocyclus nassatus]
MLPLLALLPVVLAESFWMTAELLRVDWKEGCLNTGGCSQPRFKILEDMLPLNEKVSISWPVSEHFVQDAARSFVSHWSKGRPEDLTLSCQVVGTDPTYGFPRICDQTASIRVLREGDAEAFESNRRHHQPLVTTALPEEELGKKVVEIRAKCFNVTVAVQKHTERCPWCPDPSDVTLIEQRVPVDASPALITSIFPQLSGEDKILHASVLVLAVITVLTTLGFACVLIAFLRQKRNHRQISVKPRYQPCSPTVCKMKEENKYDTPWEHSRQLTYWLTSSSKSEATTTSPLASASSLGNSSFGTSHGFRAGCAIPQTQLHTSTLRMPQ